jgi:hypothetical protein
MRSHAFSNYLNSIGTELPILLKGCAAPVPVLDSTLILAQAALKVLIGDRPLRLISANAGQGAA